MGALLKVVFTSILFLSLGLSTSSAQFSELGVQEFSTPVIAPDFKLKKLEGGTVSLKELKGRIIVLNFFTTW